MRVWIIDNRGNTVLDVKSDKITYHDFIEIVKKDFGEGYIVSLTNNDKLVEPFIAKANLKSVDTLINHL